MAGRVRGVSGGTKNLEAYQLARRGQRLFRRFTKEGNAEARRLLQKAVEVDPNYAFGWYFIGNTHQVSMKYGWGEGPAQEEARAVELAHKALAIDPSGAGPYNLLANISLNKRLYDEAIAFGEKAVTLAPNSSALVSLLGRTLVYAGRPEEGLPLIQRAIRLSPYTTPNVLRHEGLAYYSMERYEEAIAAFERARARGPKSPLPHVWLALTYADMGRMEEARAAAQEVLEVNPSFSAKAFVNAVMAFKDRAKPKRALATLLQLGLPE
jgi:adenylate cyclase